MYRVLCPLSLTQAAITQYHTWNSLNNSNLVSHGLEDWKCQHGQFLVMALFMVCRQLPPPRVLTWQREREQASSLVSLIIRGLIPQEGFNDKSLSKLNYLPKALSPNAIT